MIANVRDDPARFGRLDTVLKGRGVSERLDRGIDTNPTSELLDLFHWIAVAGIDHGIGTDPFGQGFTVRLGLYGDHQARAKESRGHRGAQTDRSLGKNGDRTTDRNLSIL